MMETVFFFFFRSLDSLVQFLDVRPFRLEQKRILLQGWWRDPLGRLLWNGQLRWDSSGALEMFGVRRSAFWARIRDGSQQGTLRFGHLLTLETPLFWSPFLESINIYQHFMSFQVRSQTCILYTLSPCLLWNQECDFSQLFAQIHPWSLWVWLHGTGNEDVGAPQRFAHGRWWTNP